MKILKSAIKSFPFLLKQMRGMRFQLTDSRMIENRQILSLILGNQK